MTYLRHIMTQGNMEDELWNSLTVQDLEPFYFNDPDKLLEYIGRIVVSVAVIVICLGTVTGLNSAISQSEEETNNTSTTSLEELQNQSFSQVVISSEQIDEIRKAVDSANEAAQNWNLANLIAQLKILGNQIDFLGQQTNALVS